MKNELRLGNWVIYESTAHYITVLMSNGLVYSRWSKQTSEEQDYQHTYLDITPIPITIEILQQCGFVGKYKSCGYLYSKGIVQLSSQDEDDNGEEIKDYVLHFYHNWQGAPIYYVHQLQNLYFALTGEELNINL